jgi:O-antigen/teichoic acid export membrane protein
MGLWVSIIVRAISELGYFPKTIWVSAAVGFFAGLILALGKDDIWIMLYGVAVGFAVGIFLELIVRLIKRINHRQRARE